MNHGIPVNTSFLLIFLPLLATCNPSEHLKCQALPPAAWIGWGHGKGSGHWLQISAFCGSTWDGFGIFLDPKVPKLLDPQGLMFSELDSNQFLEAAPCFFPSDGTPITTFSRSCHLESLVLGQSRVCDRNRIPSQGFWWMMCHSLRLKVPACSSQVFGALTSHPEMFSQALPDHSSESMADAESVPGDSLWTP